MRDANNGKKERWKYGSAETCFHLSFFPFFTFHTALRKIEWCLRAEYGG